jgi:AcrR family transcriptional regulator
VTFVSGSHSHPESPSPSRAQAQAKTPKAEKTRAVIAEAALRLFQEYGYEATTMRAIAREAGVATGNAYYYFSSKEELVREHYARAGAEHAAACRAVLASQTRFGPRLRGVLRALVETQAPYRSFAATVYSRSADTASPLSPFSAQAAAARTAAVALYGEVIDGSRLHVPAFLRERLPWLLWLYSMGIMLFWSRDTSPAGQRTLRLIDATVPIVTRLITLARIPVCRGVARQLGAVIDEWGGAGADAGGRATGARPGAR